MSATTHTKESYDKRYSAQDLYELYWVDGLTLREMADELDCAYQTVVDRMDEYGIERRRGGRSKVDGAELYRLIASGVSTLSGLTERCEYDERPIEQTLYELRDGGFVDAEMDVNGTLQWYTIEDDK